MYPTISMMPKKTHPPRKTKKEVSVRALKRKSSTRKGLLPAAILSALVFLGMLVDVTHQLVYPTVSLAQSMCFAEQPVNLSITDSNTIQEIVINLPSCMSEVATVTVRGYEGHQGDGCTHSSSFGPTCQGRESVRFDIAPQNTEFLPAGEYIDRGKLYQTFQVQNLINQSRGGTAQVSFRYTGKPYNNDSTIPVQRNSLNITSVRVDKGDVRSQSTPTGTSSPSVSPTPVSTVTPVPTLSSTSQPSASSGTSSSPIGGSGGSGGSTTSSSPATTPPTSGGSTPQPTPWTYTFLEAKCGN